MIPQFCLTLAKISLGFTVIRLIFKIYFAYKYEGSVRQASDRLQGVQRVYRINIEPYVILVCVAYIVTYCHIYGIF